MFVTAALGKVGGCGVAARLNGLSWRESLSVGWSMNTKGLVEIIILNIGLDNGIITPQIFAIMVLFAIATTVLTSPLIDLLYPTVEYEIPSWDEDKLFEAKDFPQIISKELNMVIAIPGLRYVSNCN